MEGVYWYTSRQPYSLCICAEFDGRTRRVRLPIERVDAEATLVRHAVEQLTLSIRATRRALAQQRAFSELH